MCVVVVGTVVWDSRTRASLRNRWPSLLRAKSVQLHIVIDVVVQFIIVYTKGRESLQATAKIATETLNLDVIYGGSFDTQLFDFRFNNLFVVQIPILLWFILARKRLIKYWRYL
jgi:hypothetical protein